jgi:predicted ATPase
MTLIFRKNKKNDALINQAVLRVDNWDDYGFKTLFHLKVFDNKGNQYDIGSLKIGYLGQTDDSKTAEQINDEFQQLPNDFFSLGQDPEYYKNIKDKLPDHLSEKLLSGLHDVVNNEELLNKAKKENVFITSLLRGGSLSTIYGQYNRVLSGDVLLTNFHFFYKKNKINLEFCIEPLSKPPTNIHILIGRNGVGKTTLLNDMITTTIEKSVNPEKGGFFTKKDFYDFKPIEENYFSSITSVAFSAFDTFSPPTDQPDRGKGTCYYYIGLQNNNNDNSFLKSRKELCKQFVDALNFCLKLPKKKELWLNAIKRLESDTNFKEINLSRLSKVKVKANLSKKLFKKLSSGHAVILLSLTKLIETVEEKTLVLIDEPESHLHPPLLSAFMRALSDLLTSRNAVAIIATHSPVVLQEVPKSCVWKLRRTGLVARSDRPEDETFGENVGILTREIFGLEVVKSGFHQLLKSSVKKGKAYEEILKEYDNQIGFEGRVILKSLILSRNNIKK